MNIFKSFALLTFAFITGTALTACAAVVPEGTKDNTVYASTVAVAAATDVDGTIREDPSTGMTEQSGNESEGTSAQILRDYSENLEFLYGKTFRGSLWKADKEEHKKTRGYDYSDIPVGNAASYIFDFDQDGVDELLTVSINEDHTLTLTMFETGEDNSVHPSASFLSVLDRDGKEFPVYAVEQGEGMTDVFLYENKGPKICIDSVGEFMNSSGVRHAIVALTYDGTAFTEYTDPFFDTASGAYTGELADIMCRSLESFGAQSMEIGKLNQICLFKTPFMEYLQGVREIYRAEAVMTVENEALNEWISSETEDSIEVTSIYFKDENELYDHEKAERYSEFLPGNTHKVLPFCEELMYHGTLYWRTTFAASGADGNLYRAGYSRLDFDQEALMKGSKTRFGELELTFWVTEDKIYLIDNLSDEDKKVLLENGTLPDGAALVCSIKDMPDSLEKGEAGEHQSIETNSMGYVQYRRYNVPFTNFEPRYLLTMVWKKGEGLIGYQNKRTPAGAECIQVWNPAYMERDVTDLILK